MTYQLHHGDCLNILPMMDRDSIDALVTDPPYGLGFMGKDWDHGVPGEHFWREAYHVAKPGAHLLAFGGTRTFHRLAVAIEDAGWEIRDTVMWVYGQGFPKSHDVSKAIDREAGEAGAFGDYKTPDHAIKRKPGNERMHEGYQRPWRDDPEAEERNARQYLPATPAAAQWQGYGTALKPAFEPVIVARKPLVGTVAENVQRYGTGAMNIDGCRIGTDEIETGRAGRLNGSLFNASIGDKQLPHVGRWPANLIHDGSAEVLAGFPNQISPATYKRSTAAHGLIDWNPKEKGTQQIGFGDTGSAARFFYCAKASKQDRDEGCEGLEYKKIIAHDNPARMVGSSADKSKIEGMNSSGVAPCANHHPTVKPTSLMRYLCRLVTPPQGVILDPFMGSGSTGKAAILEGFNFIGIDTELEYVEIAARRIEHACEKVGIVVEQPMLIESRREIVDRPHQLVLI